MTNAFIDIDEVGICVLGIEKLIDEKGKSLKRSRSFDTKRSIRSEIDSLNRLKSKLLKMV